jgi:peptide/nickel transport system ATP-binding protein
MLLQDPYTMLNPLLSAGRHISETQDSKDGEHGVLRRLGDVGIRDGAIAHRYPFQLSGGQRQRVGLAAALARDCELLIADEPSTALDVTIQKEILALLKVTQKRRGMAVILITHNLRIAFSMCDRIYILYGGSMMEVGPASELEKEPMHPYTLGLLLSEPPMDRKLKELVAIPGSVPIADKVREQCAYAARCPWAMPVCREGKPGLREVAPGRYSACVRIHDILSEMGATRRQASTPAPEHLEASASPAVVSVDGLTKVFSPGHRNQVTALADVTLQIAEGESVGLIGESGSGKTTLARFLLGLETPSSGNIRIHGIECSNYGRMPRNTRRQLRRIIQIVFQDPYSTLNPARSIGSMLNEAIGSSGSKGADYPSTATDLLTLVGLPASYAKRRPSTLSGGERQRVAIARALAVRPKVLVCDEPVSALDVSVQAQILNLLKSLQNELGTAFLFITHDLAVALQVVDRVYVLCDGTVVESGPVADVLQSPKHQYTKQLVASIPRSDPRWLEVSGPL